MSDAGDPLITLGLGKAGLRGVVVQVGKGDGDHLASELERRLLEIGFVEGARVEILQAGLIGGDPLAVKLDDMRVALRRHEANSILVRVDAP
jgi:ferrous iron transport protein A